MLISGEFPIIPRSSYLWFLAKQPQFVLGSARGVFGVRSWSRPAVLLLVPSRGGADGPVGTGPAQVLAEVLKRVVPRRLKAGLKGLHHDGGVLGESEEREELMDGAWRDGWAPRPPLITYPALIYGLGGADHPV